MFEVGQIVFSKAGRDKKKAFIVVSVEDDYLYLCDGDLRLLSKPKKKKIMHVQKTNTVISELKYKLENQTALDADLRKALVLFVREV